MKKIAIVVQRYGDEIVGGAEAHAREIAERLAKELSWKVDVLTTCAKDYRTWKNEFPEESLELNGVHVKRFRSFLGRSSFFPFFNRFISPLILRMKPMRLLRPLTVLLEWLWVILQGPVNFRLASYLKKNKDNYDAFFFFTYLYLPTLWGVFLCKEKSVLIPTAHDEPPFYFSVYQKMLEAVPKILANSEAEKRLLAAHIQKPNKIRIAGLGFDPVIPVQETEQAPYLLYLGRLSKGKGVDKLVSYFLNYLKTSQSHLELYLAGKTETDFAIPEHPQIRNLGFISGYEKNRLLHGTLCVVNPSPLESLSLLVLEGIVRERPVLVNGECEVLKDYTKTCESVFSYESEEEFLSKLEMIRKTDWKAPSQIKKLGDAKVWAERRYSWDTVLGEYKRCV